MSRQISIRPEQPSDWQAVAKVNRSAFESPLEAELVDGLRKRAAPWVSLVAELDGAVVGHILFTPVSLMDHEGLNLMGLGPMAVAPIHQRQGIGSLLVRAGLEQCRAMGVGGVVVLGHPQYYPRFGFRPAARHGINCQYDAPADAFMLLELVPGYLGGACGTIRYHPAFDEG
jgi:putative acetyltransferase